MKGKMLLCNLNHSNKNKNFFSQIYLNKIIINILILFFVYALFIY